MRAKCVTPTYRNRQNPSHPPPPGPLALAHQCPALIFLTPYSFPFLLLFRTNFPPFSFHAPCVCFWARRGGGCMFFFIRHHRSRTNRIEFSRLTVCLATKVTPQSTPRRSRRATRGAYTVPRIATIKSIQVTNAHPLRLGVRVKCVSTRSTVRPFRLDDILGFGYTHTIHQ